MTAAGQGAGDALVVDLSAVVGKDQVLLDADLRATYETDWTRRFSGAARAVVRPATTEEVTGVLRACARHGAAVVTQGGNTGLVGGGVPAGGEVVLSTTRLRGLGDVDPVAAQLTVGAGATLVAVQEHVRPHRLDVGMDLAARESATVGGLVSTNAGGERVLRYGSMRSQVAGLEAVLADGSVVSRLAGLPKDNTGYDLVGLLAGSEGTLAVITQVRLRLVPLLTERAVALLAVDGTAAAQRALAALRARLPQLDAAELFYAAGLALVRAHTGLAAPVAGEHPAYLLVEVADRLDPTEALLEALEQVVGDESCGVRDAVVASDPRGRAGLWRYREAHTESINAAGIPVKLDVAVPLAMLEQAVERLPAAAAAACPQARTIVFGHLNEGNLHLNVLDAGERHEEVTGAVLRLVTSMGGSISAEHGVGRAKAAWLPLSRTDAELTAMRAIKTAFDPSGMLNPGVLVQPNR